MLYVQPCAAVFPVISVTCFAAELSVFIDGEVVYSRPFGNHTSEPFPHRFVRFAEAFGESDEPHHFSVGPEPLYFLRNR